MQHADNEGKGIYTRDELLAHIRTSLGGRAAEIVCYGEKDGISTGASGDLSSATSIAMRIVCAYGMVEDFGLAVFDGVPTTEVRAAVNKILREQMAEAVRLITENKSKLDALVSELLAKSSLTAAAIEQILAD
jgi:ATP-dependent Zn protease